MTQVFWPAGGETQTFGGAVMDRVYRIVEGDPALAPVTAPSFAP